MQTHVTHQGLGTAGLPAGRPSPPSWASPSSSSSAFSASQQQQGFDSNSSSQLYQQQSQLEQLTHWQSLQQQQNQGVVQHVQSPFHQTYGPQQGNAGGVAPKSGGDEDMLTRNLKVQEILSIQAANQAQASTSKMFAEHFAHSDQKMEQRQQLASRQRSDFNAQPQQATVGQFMAANAIRPMWVPQDRPSISNIGTDQLEMAAQLQALQDWALEHNIDLSLPANANLIPQLLSLIQPRTASLQKPNESTVGAHPSRIPMSKQQVLSHPPVASGSSAPRNLTSDAFGQSGSANNRPWGTVSTAENDTMVNANNKQMQQLSVHRWESQAPPQPVMDTSQFMDRSLHSESTFSGSETSQMQLLSELQQLNTSTESAVLSDDMGLGTCIQTQGGKVAQMPQPHLGFTEQQLNVLKAQIFAFRNLKEGEGHLSEEVLRAIAPPPLKSQLQRLFLPVPVTINQDKSPGKDVEHTRHAGSNGKAEHVVSSSKGKYLSKGASFTGGEKSTSSSAHVQKLTTMMKEPTPMGSFGKGVKKMNVFSFNPEQEVECQTLPTRSDFTLDRGKAVMPQNAVSDAMQIKKSAQASTLSQPIDFDAYREPIFDIPFFSRKIGSFNSAVSVYNSSNLSLEYDVKDLLFDEGREVLNRKRTLRLEKIGGLLALNLARKTIRPDLVLRMRIQEKKLRLLELQTHVRNEVDQQQQEIMAMSDGPYRKFVQLCERQRVELAWQVQLSQKVIREKQLKSVFQWRKKLFAAHWTIRDTRIACNRGVAKYHERMLKEFSKRKDEGRNKRMEALKNNDVDRYREMLLEQQTGIPGDAAQRYAVLSSFLTQTEEYLHKLEGKIAASKNQQEAEEAANAAAFAARLQGFSKEEVRVASACAREQVIIRSRFSEMNAPKESLSNNRYYNLAHAVNEIVVKQPSMLRGGTLRDYQLVGLQWMLSLYNNNLNGILADEMGLGKTVQVMALIAYLMEFKGNCGPHLIVVPNAVLINWKSELHNWLPSLSCIFYVGGKDQRSKLFSQDVRAMKFNLLVTTYEFIMYDRLKLSKVDWKYIIIDEAQRMKDRESVMARDLDRYRCQRRLLLTGTPLQNDLKELWSLLNLLLPKVFDNSKAFHDWFSKPFQKDGPTHSAEDDWLQTETKVITIHRLHQILEPFMLRRRVEDVEGSLPPKVSVVLRCRMSAIQGAIYDWIKSTGTLRVDPEDEMRRAQKNPSYEAKIYKTLNNKCMELRKVCNHPLLNYPSFNDLPEEFIVRSCGKLSVLDPILIKLQRTGHRVLLFCTMTKLLDILGEYLEWRKLVYRRIDGTTSLEDRESAIFDFNCPGSECFIFLLSIRAAGRGLNLQSADTVVIYDPDPNPKNEEQAVARAHRIGQKREVKVIYMEAVVDKSSSCEKEDESVNGGRDDLVDGFAGKDQFMGSIESLIRKNIQQYKIEMADEVINAGRFDQRTTQEERRLTLEALLHEEDRYRETVHNVPSRQEVNRMIARSEEEVKLFDQMDNELDWTEEMTRHDLVPEWLRASSGEVNATRAKLSKKLSRNTSLSGNIGLESSEAVCDLSFETEKKRVRPKRSSRAKNFPIYKELDDEDGDFSEASSQERNGCSMHEKGDIAKFEVENFNSVVGAPSSIKAQLEGDDPFIVGSCEYPQPLKGTRNRPVSEEAGPSGSSSASQRLVRMGSPSLASQKFGSLSALDDRSNAVSKSLPNELGGEISVSGDSRMDIEQSESWFHDHEDDDDEQVLQCLKRKRSTRIRPGHTVKRLGKKHEKPSLKHGDPKSPAKHTLNLATSSKVNVLPKPRSLHCMLADSENEAEDATEHSKISWDTKPLNASRPAFFGVMMSDVSRRKCKDVINEIHRTMDKEGHQIAPLLADLWRRSENSFYMINMAGSHLLNFQKIYQRLDGLDYHEVIDFVADVQSMLEAAAQQFGFSCEVRSEVRKVEDLFFDIMKSTFPDTDFDETRNALPSSSPGATSTLLPRRASVGQSMRQKLIKDMEPEPRRLSKLPDRETISANENANSQVRLPQKESQLVSSSSSQEWGQPGESSSPNDPAEIVICKKKMKDVDNSAARPRTSCMSPSTGHNASGSGPSLDLAPGGKEVKMSRQDTHQHWQVHHPAQQADKGDEVVGWANPVRRTRTSSGRRRPTQI